MAETTCLARERGAGRNAEIERSTKRKTTANVTGLSESGGKQQTRVQIKWQSEMKVRGLSSTILGYKRMMTHFFPIVCPYMNSFVALKSNFERDMMLEQTSLSSSRRHQWPKLSFILNPSLIFLTSRKCLLSLFSILARPNSRFQLLCPCLVSESPECFAVVCFSYNILLRQIILLLFVHTPLCMVASHAMQGPFETLQASPCVTQDKQRRITRL